ncbi:hypothetical protein QYE76_025067 [Lolium multiflorum]|uniref:Integrase catalytic domain-containing protein n=1 Tax=Lolium multiflorum TaxID=4521 RepID=A0AAD8VWA6_LOLMU|nr:hypothetical protein QYE76_025067 [Lolium multiflorum]
MYESEIKAIRIDNGTKFKNYTMQEFVDDDGIEHEFSAPYTPQQNGVVERKNRTIIEMARTMLSEFKSPHKFWGEAISTAVHYSNRLFLLPLHNKTPYELLIGDDDPSNAIKLMGIGHIRPTEVHNDDQDDGIEVSSSAQVEPNSTQAEPSGATQDLSSTQDEPHSEEQEESPQPTEQDHDTDQETSSTHGQSQVVPHDQELARDEFIDHEGAIRDSSDDTRAAAKRGRNERPLGCRTSTRMTSKVAPSNGPISSTGGRTKSTEKKRKGKDTVPDSNLVEKVPTYNVGTVHIADWRRLREKNPYRFEERTYNIGDREFWTNTQMNIWDDFYKCPDLMRNGVIVQPKAINKEELTMLQATQYRFVVDTLQKMGLFDLVCLKPGSTKGVGVYCPILVRQFHCTVFFHDDVARTMTWMTGYEQYTCNYLEFCQAMGFGGGRAHGFQIHTQEQFTHGDIAFCYPPEPTHAPPTISGMYYSYQVLAKIFCESLISK